MGDGAAPRLLYIDDDTGLCRLVTRALGRRGFDVSTANDGPSGVAMARAQAFDVVAMDHYMPGQDGLTTLEQLGTGPECPPVVYVTGSDESRIAVAALKAGAADYVVKTGSEDFMDLLNNAVAQALQQVRMRRARDAAEQALVAANARLESIVERQSVLLREVNHRVANSLQLVSSLVHMQASAVKDESSREALRDTQARINAIMQIHRRLYTSEDVERVDMNEYLRGLVAELEQSLPQVKAGRPIRLDAEPVELATDKAVSLGVVVTELVTNAYKYAYAPEEAGEIRIALLPCEADQLRLTVEDDGEGFMAGSAPKGTGLGRKVIAAMAASLNSRVEFDAAHKGVRATLDFRA